MFLSKYLVFLEISVIIKWVGVRLEIMVVKVFFMFFLINLFDLLLVLVSRILVVIFSFYIVIMINISVCSCEIFYFGW